MGISFTFHQVMVFIVKSQSKINAYHTEIDQVNNKSKISVYEYLVQNAG